jgi:hypothetical protein
MYKRRFLLFGDNALNAQMNYLKPDLIPEIGRAVSTKIQHNEK